MEFNWVIPEEPIDTTFANFGEGLVTALQGIIKHVKMHTFLMGVMEGSFLYQSFHLYIAQKKIPCYISNFRVKIIWYLLHLRN